MMAMDERRARAACGPSRWGRAWMAAGLVVLAGCASSRLAEESRRTQAHLVAVGRSVEELRHDVDRLGGDVAALRGELQATRAELGAALREGDGRQRTAVEAARERLAVTEARVATLADTVTGLEGSLGGLAEQVAHLEALAPTVSSGVADGKGSRRTASRTGSTPLGPEELFDRAMESFRAGELGQAVLDFEELTGKYPTHALVASAQFWIGEAYFRAREYQTAAVAYQKAIDTAPSGERTADALFKLGLAQRALRREDRAREVWAQLMRDFPDSEAAQRARREAGRPGRPGAPVESR